MKIIEVLNEKGEQLAVCDEKCYDAKTPFADSVSVCVCLGRNHGRGRATALGQLRTAPELVKLAADQYIYQQGFPTTTVILGPEAMQETIKATMEEIRE